jgi:endonuclease/exonuclease/phosphatase family metal-dependent hydrolase
MPYPAAMTQTAPLTIVTPHDLTIATYNMQKGFGHDMRRLPDRTHQVIAAINPDILALQEADRRFRTRAGVLDLARLHEETGLSPVPLGEKTGSDAHGWHGNLLLTRDALIRNVRTLRLPGVEPRGAVITDLSHNGRNLRVIAAHMGLLSYSRKSQARQLAEEIAEDGTPTILMGDLNEWRRGATSPLAPLFSRFTQVGMGPSFPAAAPLLALDRIFVSGATAAFDVSVHDTGPARRASDHLPLVARIRF